MWEWGGGRRPRRAPSLLPPPTWGSLVPGNPPARIFQSTGLTPAAATATRSSPLSRVGTGTRVTASVEGGPWAAMTMASMQGPIAGMRSAPSRAALASRRQSTQS